MRRHGNLWERMTCFASLLRAANTAQRGKRFRPRVAAFHFDLERELWRLHDELRGKSYRPGSYQTFFVYEPKRRLISAAPYRDRVVHHALTQVLEPIFERSFIADSHDKRELAAIRDAIREFLVRLRLRLHPHKNTILPVTQGIRFLGYRVFPSHRLLVKENVRRFRRRVRRMQHQFASRQVGPDEIRQRLMSWSGHARQADTFLLRQRLFATIGFRRAPSNHNEHEGPR